MYLWISAEPSPLLISTVCLLSRFVDCSLQLGLACLIISSAPIQPSGTLTNTLRFLSPQQILVGASWCGTNLRYDVGIVLPKAVSASASDSIPAIRVFALLLSLLFSTIALRPSFSSIM